MKITKSNIKSGVRLDGDKFVFDRSNNLPSDIVDLVSPQIYQSKFGKYTYWFGYKFNDSASSKDRSEFIHAIKGLSDISISDEEITEFIDEPIFELDRFVNTYGISAIIYPVSGRSKLVSKIIYELSRFTSHDTRRLSFELVKSVPTDISFDWDSFEADTIYDKNKYEQMKEYVESKLLPAIHSLDYFSLAQNVKPKYRKYIKNYLTMSENDVEKLASLKGGTILIVDDINTSGATIEEILRKVRKINNYCEIFIYTLIGR